MAADTAEADEYNGGDLLATVVPLLVLTWFSVALRTYVRAVLTKSFKYDDWLMLVAQVNFTLSSAFIAVGLRDGLGHHNAFLPQHKKTLALKWQAIATATYITNMMFIKLSIGVFLLRLATQRRYKWIIWISMGIVASMSSALFLWDIFQCKPVAAQWDLTLPNYTCVGPDQIVDAAYVLSVLSILSDWLYALLPIPMLWNAKMTPQAKATVSVVLGLGIFASIATLIRVKFLADLVDTDDILFAGTDPMVWTLIEPGVAIVASSLVTIRPLLRQMRLKGFESSQRQRSRSEGGFWGRYGRSGGKASKLQESGDVSSRRNRAGSGMVAFEQDDIALKNLEAGHGTSGGGVGREATTTTTTTKNKKKSSKGYSSRDTTLTSQGSARESGAMGISPARNYSNPLGVTVKEETKEVHSGDGDDDDNDDGNISPVSLWPRVGARANNSDTLFRMQEQGTTLRGHLQNGKPMWRTETPNSAEEAEAIQGLRELSSRTAKDRSPFS